MWRKLIASLLILRIRVSRIIIFDYREGCPAAWILSQGKGGRFAWPFLSDIFSGSENADEESSMRRREKCVQCGKEENPASQSRKSEVFCLPVPVSGLVL